MFIKVSGFDGSVTGKGHEKWSHVDGYQHTIRGAEIGDTRFGRVEHEPLAVL
jgi:type VI protein secretion system component Hcp